MQDPAPTPARPAGRRSRKLRAGFILGTNILLLLLLSAQGILCWQKTVPVPDFLLEKVHQLLLAEGLRADAGQVRLRAPNRLILHSPRIESRSHPGLLLEADLVEVEFSFLAFFIRDFSPRALAVDNGRFACPPELRKSGGSDLLVRDLYLRASSRESGWDIQQLLLRTGDLSASLAGPTPEPPDEPPPEVEELTWNEILVLAADEFGLVKEDYLDGLEEGFLRVGLGHGGSGTATAEVGLSGASYRHDVSGLEIRHPEARGRFILDGDGSQRPGWAEFKASSVRYRDKGEIRNVAAALALPGTLRSGEILPTEVQVVARSATAFDEHADDLYLAGRRVGPHSVDLSFFGRYQGDPLDGRAEFDWRSGAGLIAARADLNPTPVLRHPLVRETGLNYEVIFKEAPEFEGTLEFGPDWEPVIADLELRAGACRIDGVEMDAARAIARWLPEKEFDVPVLVLTGADFRSSGSYRTDLQTRDYRLLFSGTLRPAHIAPWFENWWSVLWEEFDFAGPPPASDVDIQGNWQRPENLRLTGRTQAEDLRFRGVELEGMRAHYTAAPKEAHVLHGVLDRPEGAVGGSFLYRNNEDDWSVEFDIDSNVDAGVARDLLGDEAGGILKEFSFESPPRIQARGRLFEGGLRPETRLEVAAQSESPLTFSRIPLDHLDIEGILNGSDLDLSFRSIGFSGGIVDGAVLVALGGGDPIPLSINLSVKDTRFGKGLEELAEAGVLGEVDADARKELGNLGGKVDLEVRADGRLGDPLSFEGEGKVHVREAELGRVRLLGMLSRLLERTPLRFTSLQLNEAQSSFQLANEHLRFPDLQLTGPNVGLEANGEYSFESQALDFKVNLFLLRESPIPLISEVVGRILAPFGHVLELSLSGTLDDPRWRLPLDPRSSPGDAPHAAPRQPGRR